MALSFCSETQMHILQSLDVNTIFVVKEVFMNERSPSKMLQSQSETFLGLLKAAPYLITLLSNVVLQSIFHALRITMKYRGVANTPTIRGERPTVLANIPEIHLIG